MRWLVRGEYPTFVLRPACCVMVFLCPALSFSPRPSKSVRLRSRRRGNESRLRHGIVSWLRRRSDPLARQQRQQRQQLQQPRFVCERTVDRSFFC